MGLSSCGGGSGADTKPFLTPHVRQPAITVALHRQTMTFRHFRLNFWDNLARQDRCAGAMVRTASHPSFDCGMTISISPMHEANRIVFNLFLVDSLVVAKVGGHHCWLASDAGCAEHAGELHRTLGRWRRGHACPGMVLRAPSLKDPSSSKSFPTDSADFRNTVYPLLRTCVACHIENGQTPYIASDDEATSYAAAQSRIDLDALQLSAGATPA